MADSTTASTAPEIGGSTKGCVPTNVGCYKEEVTKSKIEVNDIDDRDKGYAAGLPCFTLCARDRACVAGRRRAHAPAAPLRARHFTIHAPEVVLRARRICEQCGSTQADR